jgi:hypothetical protein
VVETSVRALLEFVATLSASLFAGAALYINVVEHPSRGILDTPAAVAVWARSYRRATWMQAPLALLSLCGGVGAWLLGAGIPWVVGGVMIGAVVPFTFVIIMPTNHRLERFAAGDQGDVTGARTLLDHWARLHGVRTLLALAATGLYLWAGFSPR